MRGRRPCAGPLDERVEPAARSERLRGQAAEAAKLRNHVRLTGVAERRGDLRPVGSAAARISEAGLTPCEVAVGLRRKADAFTKYARQVLPRHTGRSREPLDADAAVAVDNPRRQSRGVASGETRLVTGAPHE